jgi:hypothetical protein
VNSASDWLELFNLLFAGLAAGSLAFEFLVLVPVMQRSPRDISALIHHTVLGKDQLPSRLLPPSAVAASLTAIAALIVKSHPSSGFTVLLIVGLGLMALMGLGTALVSMPMNLAIARWPQESFATPEAVPADYEPLRARWDRAMAWRTLLGVAAFVCFIAGALSG